MGEAFTIYCKRYEPTDPRLGRHVQHDSRSLNYPIEAESISSLTSKRHQRFIPILDQGNLGSCTGNAGVGCLGSDIFWQTMPSGVLSDANASADENVAVQVYSDATKVDSYKGTYPPDDTGSDGLSVAKVLKTNGWISGYQHATSFEAMLTALARQPVIVGTDFLNDMFYPDADGRLHVSGDVAGGHEYVLDEIDVENKRVWMCNSWGEGWGLNGRAYFTWDDFSNLLASDGDCTVFTPVTQPAPTPTPPAPPSPPEPTPTPTPTPPAPPVPDDAGTALLAAVESFNQAWQNYVNTRPNPQ